MSQNILLTPLKFGVLKFDKIKLVNELHDLTIQQAFVKLFLNVCSIIYIPFSFNL